MGGVALVFAGQGAQYSGMGKSLYDNSAAARALFESAEAIYPGICDMCFNGSTEQLSVTINTQPALYVVDLACAAVLDEMDVRADMTAGFSLGELAANAYAGTFAFDEGLKLVGRRAEYMDSCASNNKGYMAAVLKLPNAKVEAIAAEFEHVYPANYNAAGQLTVACGVEEYDDFVRMIGESGGRTVKLAVSGAFHSPYMTEASALFEADVEKINISAPCIPLYSNVTARPYNDDAASLLSKQIISPVKWEETILNMIADGADTFIEAGAGKVLSGLIKRISPDVKVYNTDNFGDIRNTVINLKGHHK